MNRGFFVGFGLTVWRILRCNPFGAGGHDPVPPRKRPKRIPKYQRSKTDGKEIVPNHGTDNDASNPPTQQK